MGRAESLRKDFHQRSESPEEWGEREASERTSIKGLRPPGEWGGREASERTSIKGLRPPGEWGGREASERTSIKGLRSTEGVSHRVSAARFRKSNWKISLNNE